MEKIESFCPDCGWICPKASRLIGDPCPNCGSVIHQRHAINMLEQFVREIALDRKAPTLLRMRARELLYRPRLELTTSTSFTEYKPSGLLASGAANRSGKTNTQLAEFLRTLKVPQERIEQILNGEWEVKEDDDG